MNLVLILRIAFILFLGLLSFRPQLVIGQDQRVADSLAVIYQEDELEGADKMDLLKGLSFNELNDGALSLKYAEELLRLAEDEKNSEYIFSGHLFKGGYYKHSGGLDLALENYYKALNIAIDSKNIKNEGLACISIADVYGIMENFSNSVQFYEKGIQIFRSTEDSISLAAALLNIGDTYYKMGKYEDARNYFEQAGPIFKKKNHLTGSAYYLGNMGMVYAKQGNDSLAKNYINEAVAILEDLEDYYPISVYLTIMSDIYLKQDDFDAAHAYTHRSLELAVAYGLKEQIAGAYLQLSKLHEQSGDHEEAFFNYKNHILYRDSLKNFQAIQQMADMRTDFELAQKQIEVDFLKHKRKNQQILSIVGSVASILIILMAIGLYRRYIFIKLANVKISTQRDEIIESINYARRIQSAMLPPEAHFSELLKESCILYKPRDIVSGDFYWIKQVGHYIVLVVADCTGHGVPGAFMSMLGISYLNEIAQRNEIAQADQVLNELRKKIIYSLRQDGKRDESKDGMDMALCVLDLESLKMQYAGANIPLYLIRDVKGKPELQEVKADRMPLAYYQSEDISFVSHDIQLDRGDTFYMFSDGYVDQKGGAKAKKFLSKNFKNLLLDVQDQGMVDQKETLEKTLSDWMGDHSQIDDVLVVGVRV